MLSQVFCVRMTTPFLSLVSFTPARQYSCVVVSAPTLQKGETYTVNACGQSQSVTLSSLIYGGGMGAVSAAPAISGDKAGSRTEKMTAAPRPISRTGSREDSREDSRADSREDSRADKGAAPRRPSPTATAKTAAKPLTLRPPRPVLKRYKKQRSLFEAALFLQCIIGAKSAPMKAARTVGSISICKPILPPLTKMAGSDFAVSSMTVKNAFFMPTGLHPPRI